MSAITNWPKPIDGNNKYKAAKIVFKNGKILADRIFYHLAGDVVILEPSGDMLSYPLDRIDRIEFKGSGGV